MKYRFKILWTFVVIMWLIASCNDLTFAQPIKPKRDTVRVEQINDCPCSKPIKATVNWCEGTKKGLYCKNAKGEKRYKPKK